MCKREFRTSGRRIGVGIPKRSKRDKTCSRNCSKDFSIVKSISANYYNSKLKKQKTAIKKLIKDKIKSYTEIWAKQGVNTHGRRVANSQVEVLKELLKKLK